MINEHKCRVGTLIDIHRAVLRPQPDPDIHGPEVTQTIGMILAIKYTSTSYDNSIVDTTYNPYMVLLLTPHGVGWAKFLLRDIMELR